MGTASSRREFLAQASCSALTATLGCSSESNLGLGPAIDPDPSGLVSFGALEPLVRLMEETPSARLLSILVARIKAGADLGQLVAAAACANARAFGGQDYTGYHVMMALAPSLHMARELPVQQQPLPVLKVLVRNTSRIQDTADKSKPLRAVLPRSDPGLGSDGEALRQAVFRKDTESAEQIFASAAHQAPNAALNQLLYTVQDSAEVHRVVLPYAAWDLLDLIGTEQAHTLLRQSLHYCLTAEKVDRPKPWDGPRTLLPKLFDRYNLRTLRPGARAADDAWVDRLSQTFFSSTPEQAAEAAAGALAEGFAPAVVGEAISIAANQLMLRDLGRTASDEAPGKPLGSVHGNSIGIHAIDSAYAWRNLARVSNARNTFACLIVGAYQVAMDRTVRGGDFLNWPPLPIKEQLDWVGSTAAAWLLREADEAIRENLQARTAAIISRYGELGHPPGPAFEVMLKHAVNEDGALHGEIYYRTVVSEFAATRPAFRWRHLVGLARATASLYGRPAPGLAEARALLQA